MNLGRPSNLDCCQINFSYTELFDGGRTSTGIKWKALIADEDHQENKPVFAPGFYYTMSRKIQKRNYFRIQRGNQMSQGDKAFIHIIAVVGVGPQRKDINCYNVAFIEFEVFLLFHTKRLCSVGIAKGRCDLIFDKN